MRRWLAGTATWLALLTPAGAQAPARLLATPIAVPHAAYLPTVGHVYQTLNNCGPASVLSVLQHYNLYAGTQAELGKRLKPGKYMTTEVIAPFFQQFGLSAPIYRQGSIQHLRPFIASGIPIIILQYLNGPGTVAHFRVVRGYDDAAQRMFMSDSMYGPNVYLSYADFNKLWLYDNEFIPVYPQALGPLVASIVAGTAYKTAVQN